MPKLLPTSIAVFCAVLGLAPAVDADTAVGESIWDQQNAVNRAMESVPAGAQVTATQCESVEVGIGNYHYICRITYTPPASPGTGISPSPTK